MAVSNAVRYQEKGPYYNPKAIFEIFKPSRILVKNVDPVDGEGGDGEDKDYFINSLSGSFWQNTLGEWTQIYTFAGGGGGGGTVGNIINLGTGVGLFANLTGAGTTANFKSILSDPAEITVGSLPNEVTLAMNPLYKPAVFSEIASNLIVTRSFAAAPVNPNGALGIDDGFDLGSIFVQSSGPPILWVFRNNTGKIWTRIGGPVSDLQNIGFGHGIYKNEVDGVGFLKTLISNAGEITIAPEGLNELKFSMSSLYKPVSLNKISNVLNNFDGTQPAPGPTNDSVAGYQRGSVWTSGSDLYICIDATAGAAVWVLVNTGASPVSEKDLFSVYKTGAAVPSTSFPSIGTSVKLNIGASLTEIVARGVWSSDSLGFGSVITRTLPTNGLLNNRYLVTYNLELFVGTAILSERAYTLTFNYGNGATPAANQIPGSTVRLAVPVESNTMTISGSFMIVATTAGPISFFPSIQALTTSAIDVFTERITINITEI